MNHKRSYRRLQDFDLNHPIMHWITSQLHHLNRGTSLIAIIYPMPPDNKNSTTNAKYEYNSNSFLTSPINWRLRNAPYLSHLTKSTRTDIIIERWWLSGCPSSASRSTSALKNGTSLPNCSLRPVLRSLLVLLLLHGLQQVQVRGMWLLLLVLPVFGRNGRSRTTGCHHIREFVV